MIKKIIIILCLSVNNAYAITTDEIFALISSFLENKKIIKLKSFSLIDTQGDIHTDKSTKGRYLIVNFWASWCAPCLQEIPSLVKLYHKYPQKLQILGLNFEQTNKKMLTQFIDKFAINYPIIPANDKNRPQFKVFEKMKVLPTTHIYNPQGELVKSHEGIVNINTIKNIINPQKTP